tara:strand:+ start:402 stop:614 length:213 start_codon:yes stop_codon:yes gene_type:complete
MSKMIPVEGHKNLYRDENTNAIVSRDTAAYENYIALRNKNRDKQDELDDMKKEINELKSLLNDLASKITS